MDELEEERLLRMLRKTLKDSKKEKNKKEKLSKDKFEDMFSMAINEVLSPNFKISIESDADSKSKHTLSISGTRIGIQMGLSYLIDTLMKTQVLSKEDIIEAIRIGLDGD